MIAPWMIRNTVMTGNPLAPLFNHIFRNPYFHVWTEQHLGESLRSYGGVTWWNLPVELAVFGTEGFTEDREGISIYEIDDGTGYILVSDQQANAFRIFKREGEPGDPHNHQLVKVVNVSTNESDGSDITTSVLDARFPSGLFVAMSDNRTFHFYSWDDIAGDDLKKAPNGIALP